jgi:hypothetical protein
MRGAHTIVFRRSDADPQNLQGIATFVSVFLLAATGNAAFIIFGFLVKVTT